MRTIIAFESSTNFSRSYQMPRDLWRCALLCSEKLSYRFEETGRRCEQLSLSRVRRTSPAATRCREIFGDAPCSAQKSSVTDLKKLADDANNYRFREFDELLPQLPDAERSLAMRLALLRKAQLPI